MRFVDLFAGLGGFHRALADLGHECVFACEIDDELRSLYAKNFRLPPRRLGADIRVDKNRVPSHDVLCAGFPCQPFSKSGSQLGSRDRTRGTLFDEILAVVDARRPKVVLLENVGNFERHDKGRTWQVVKKTLTERGYQVRGTEHVTSGGHGLISPHHFGYPHHRERFFIVATLDDLPPDPFPRGKRNRSTSLWDLVEANRDLSQASRAESALSDQQTACIDHWNAFLQAIPPSIPLPSFPIWGDELWERYPFEDQTPFSSTLAALRRSLPPQVAYNGLTRTDMLAKLPSYARDEVDRFASWKVAFIRKNREWFDSIRHLVEPTWIAALRQYPPSLRKLEWNCKGETRDLWKHVLQFRPSGLRVKRFSSCPALVAMTVTQIPILGPKGRFITRTEALRLQGFPDRHLVPTRRDDAFRALGNAVHVGVVREIADVVLSRRFPASSDEPQLGLPFRGGNGAPNDPSTRQVTGPARVTTNGRAHG